jgi:MoxR-like ATPase
MDTQLLDNLSKEELLRYNNYRKPSEHEVYILPDELKEAVKVAIMLQQPLLITGEPGTGKTSLAYKLAIELHRISEGRYREEPYFFPTKSNSSASELFYTYDAISHFFDANIAKNEDMVTRLPKMTESEMSHPASEKKRSAKGTWKYINLQAFGKAIISSLPPEKRLHVHAANIDEVGEKDIRNSVVLIDEIDKASRDFPNDILNEIEKYRFSIRETGFTLFEKEPSAHILLIMTSNSEKALPEPFLRRCVFYHIKFPTSEQLKVILEGHSRFFEEPASDKLIRWTSEKFYELREVCREKKPATAELITWLRYLAEKKFDPEKPDLDIIKESLSSVIKNSDDNLRALELKWQ